MNYVHMLTWYRVDGIIRTCASIFMYAYIVATAFYFASLARSIFDNAVENF